VINITGYAGRTSVSGCDTTYIRINYSSTSNYDFMGVTEFRIVTDHTYALYNFLNATLGSGVSVDRLPTYVKISPQSPVTLNLYMKVVKIYAQVGFGWMGES
jgi:hypothetical protein